MYNTLGLRASSASELYGKLEAGAITAADVDTGCRLHASQTSYADSVCRCEGHDGKQVARFNADTSGPSPNRSEGKVMILASVHDTFEAPKRTSTMWLSVNDLETAQQLKRDVCLRGGPADLPISCEYLDRDSVTAVDEAGRVLCWMIAWIGIGTTLKSLWDLKLQFEALPIPFATISIKTAMSAYAAGQAPRNKSTEHSTPLIPIVAKVWSQRLQNSARE